MVQDTYNPIIKEEVFKRSFLVKVPIPSPNSAILLMTRENIGQALCIKKNSLATPAEVRRGKYDYLVEIDTNTHFIKMKSEVISADNVSKFHVEISMTAAVTDPIMFYEERVTNVGKRIESELVPVLQDNAYEYDVEDVNDFRAVLRNELGNFTLVKCGITLSNFNIAVQVDEKYKAHLLHRKDLKYKEQIDQEKAEIAKKMSDVYSDGVTAAFAEFADGKIDSMEALELIRKNKSADFDANMEKVQRAVEFIKGMRDDGIVAENIVNEKLSPLISALLGEVAPLTAIGGKGAQELSEKQENGESKKAYAPFDDEE